MNKSINIQELQINKKEEEITNLLLKDGDLVTSYEVNKMLSSHFENVTAGLPTYKPKELIPYAQSDKEDFNVMFKAIHDDLKVAYEVHNNQVQYSLAAQENYESELNSLQKQSDELILHQEILDKYAREKAAYSPNVLTFSTLKNVNTKNLIKHNIPATSSEFDFITSSLRNELHSTPNDKIDISNADISINVANFKLKYTGDIKSVFSDSRNKLLNVSAEGMSNSMAELVIDIHLKDKVDVSRIDFSGYSLFNTSSSLYVSEDGENYFDKENIKGGSHNIFRFNKMKIKSIKIIISKTSHDYTFKDKFQFYFVIRNISIYNDKYSRQSVYTSKSIEFDTPVSDIILDPMHSLPPLTDIGYFVGVENGDMDVEWKTATPGEEVDLGLLDKEEMVLNYYTSDLFGAWDFDRAAEQFCFYIHELPKNTNLNSIEMRTGHSQWLLERLDVEPTDNKVNLSDYNKAAVSEIAPLDATMLEIRCEKPNNYVVMSQSVICKEETIVENRHITFEADENKEKFDVVVLINGKQIFEKNEKYSFKLKKGENLVQIIYVLNNLDVSVLASTKTIKHNFNLMAYSSSIFAGPKMQRIAYSSLSKNVDKHSLKYYAIKTVKGQDRISSKFDPNFVIKPNDPVRERKKLYNTGDGPAYVIPDIKLNNSEYFRVYIKFKSMKDETLETLRNSDGDAKVRVRVMAKLSSSDISVTPVINSIKVVGK